MTGVGPRRVRGAYVERLMETLSDRDWSIIGSLYRVRLASGSHLERLHFADLALRSRSVMRWRVLKRLVDARVLTVLDRRVGSSRRGSAQLCYALDSAGQQLVRWRLNAESPEARIRRPRPPGERFIAHALAVTEVYVSLVEHSRIGRFRLEAFEIEGAAYWPNGLRGWLKPDAFVKLTLGSITDYWWIEADLATESLPTIRTKLIVYLDFVIRGQLGPDEMVPRVLIGVPTAARQVAIRRVVSSLPEPAIAMFQVVLLSDTAMYLVQELTG